jgi:EAL domain-containing protein (putative c-di-GMP-specific phosphodiesterase class I)
VRTARALAASAPRPHGERERLRAPGARRRLPRGRAGRAAPHRLPAGALVLEITESVLLEDDDETVLRLGALRDLGVRIALDDFGTGYSSLGYLRRFPVDTLKIDRSFVSGPASETADDQLVRTILDLGRAYGLGVVAEGIEDDAQRQRLQALGCRLGQGYHFGRPADVAGTEAHLAAQRRVPLQRQPAGV